MKLTDQQIATLIDIAGTDQWHEIETTCLIDLIELHIEYLRDVMHGPALASRVFVLRNIARKLTLSDPTGDVVILDTTNIDTRWHCPKCPNRVTTHLAGTTVWCNRHAGGLVPMKADD